MRVAPLEATIARSHGDPTNGLIRRQWVDWISSVDRFVVISGCSSGGKSTLIAELGKRGHAVVEEPGRRIVKEELASGGSALPWVDRIAFARRAITMALADRAAAGSLDGWVFFDRGLIDAVAALEHMTGKPVLTALGQANRYHRRVFLAPPWPEIYETDPERRHGLDVALAEYSRLLETYPSLGYEVLILPKVGVSERANFVLNTLEA
jgi:predicted ATPase